MNKKLLLLTVFIFHIGINHLYADEFYNVAQMQCFPSTNSAIIRNLDPWNEKPTEDEYTFQQLHVDKESTQRQGILVFNGGECIFPNGREIRIRLSYIDQHSPCSHSSASLLKIWINQKKALSQVYINECLPQSYVESLEIKEKTIRLCTYEVSGMYNDINLSKKTCKELTIDENSEIDTIEYQKETKTP